MECFFFSLLICLVFVVHHHSVWEKCNLWSYKYTRICWMLGTTALQSPKSNQFTYVTKRPNTSKFTEYWHTAHPQGKHPHCMLNFCPRLIIFVNCWKLALWDTPRQIKFSVCINQQRWNYITAIVGCYLWNGIGARPGHVSILSKYFTGTTPSKPSVKITLLSEI